MIPMRYSSATEPNTGLKNTAADQSTVESISTRGPRKHETSNAQWLRDSGITEGIILLGGTSVAHFRLRVAQAQLRSDLLPSYWSLAGILLDGEQFASVPLDTLEESSLVPITNGVQICNIADYDDTTRFPNIAVLQFTKDSQPVIDTIKRVKLQRSIIDLPTLILAWLGYIWGAGQQGNPLLNGMGVPSAAFVETAYGIAGVELTPGLSSAASCPEAIWQSAKWWHDFYARPRGVQNRAHAKGMTPIGVYAIRQPSAAAIGPYDEKVGEQIVSTQDRSTNNDETEAGKTTGSEDAAQRGIESLRKSSKKSSTKRPGGKKRK
jgi:hypothetical protein